VNPTRLSAVLAMAALVAFPSLAAAQPAPPAPPTPSAPPASPPAKGGQSKGAARRLEPKEPAPPVAPAPDVRLTLQAPSAHGPWTMRVTNAGDVPVRLVADARLLWLDVTARGETRPVRCELPADMRAADDTAGAVVLPPGRSYVESLQPVLYCFGGRALGALAQGAIVVGHLGWTGHGARAPFVVAPIDGVEPAVAAVHRLDAPPIAVPDDPTPPDSSGAHTRPDDPDRVKLTLRGQAAVDAGSASHLFVTVTVRNDGTRPVTLRFRPEALRFRVSAPGGAERCRWPMPPVAAMRDLFTTIRPGGSESQTVLLSAYCGGHAFDQPGLLVLVPELDTRRASGAEIALATFDGDVVATSPTYVRLHEGIKPVTLRRPRLEAVPGAAASAAPGASGTAAPAPAPAVVTPAARP